VSPVQCRLAEPAIGKDDIHAALDADPATPEGFQL